METVRGEVSNHKRAVFFVNYPRKTNRSATTGRKEVEWNHVHDRLPHGAQPWRSFRRAATFLGCLLAEIAPVSRRRFSLALHGAAGIVIAVVAIEITPRAKTVGQVWVMVSAFVAGGLFFILADSLLGIVRRRMGTESKGGGPWLIYFAVAVDLVSDGIMIGAGATVAPHLALLLALGQVAADIPERNPSHRSNAAHGRAAEEHTLALRGRIGSAGAPQHNRGLPGATRCSRIGEDGAARLHCGDPHNGDRRGNDARSPRSHGRLLRATLCFVLGFAGFWSLTAALG